MDRFVRGRVSGPFRESGVPTRGQWFQIPKGGNKAALKVIRNLGLKRGSRVFSLHGEFDGPRIVRSITTDGRVYLDGMSDYYNPRSIKVVEEE